MTGDGKADILWQRDDGLMAMWTMDGPTATNMAIMNSAAGWHVI